MKPTNSPNPRPTQPKEKIGVKWHFLGHFFATASNFSWVLGSILCRKTDYKKHNPAKILRNTSYGKDRRGIKAKCKRSLHFRSQWHG